MAGNIQRYPKTSAYYHYTTRRGTLAQKKTSKPLASFAKQYSQQQAKSVVVVQRALALEDFELSLHIAPTLQEAYDLIELDEIERDLWK